MRPLLLNYHLIRIDIYIIHGNKQKGGKRVERRSKGGKRRGWRRSIGGVGTNTFKDCEAVVVGEHCSCPPVMVSLQELFDCFAQASFDIYCNSKTKERGERGRGE